MGSVVFLKEDLSRGVWKIGKIIELILSNDGEFRVVKVFFLIKKVFKRFFNYFYSLECGIG